MTPIIGGLIEAALKIIEKVLPNPEAKAAAQLKLLEMSQQGELAALAAEVQLAKNQTDINLEEAKSSSLFKGGWRPAIGWVGAFALLYQYIGRPLLTWYSTHHNFTPPPALDLGDLLTIVGGMLGLGTLRTFERINKVIPQGK
jgi:hypothetical protein